MAGLVAAVVLLVVAAANLEALPDMASSLPPEFKKTFLTVHLWQWCLLVVLFLLSLIAGFVGRAIAKKLSILRDRVVPHPMSATTRVAIVRSSGLLVGAVTAATLLPSLRLNEVGHMIDGHPVGSLESHVETLVMGLIAVSITLLVYAYWDATCDTLAARAVGSQRAERLLVPMMRKLVQAVIAVVGILVVLAIFFGAKTLSGLVAGLGVTGLVVALAGKDSIENLFGSLTILFDMPFALGDYVRIDKVEGSVEEINLRSTRIRTIQDTLILLPNANLIRASVENFGARRLRRQSVNIRVNYASDPDSIEKFCDALREHLLGQEGVEPSKVQVQLDDPTETSIGIIAIWSIDAKTALEEAKSRSKFLNEALRLKRLNGLYLANLPAIDPPKK